MAIEGGLRALETRVYHWGWCVSRCGERHTSPPPSTDHGHNSRRPLRSVPGSTPSLISDRGGFNSSQSYHPPLEASGETQPAITGKKAMLSISQFVVNCQRNVSINQSHEWILSMLIMQTGNDTLLTFNFQQNQ